MLPVIAFMTPALAALAAAWPTERTRPWLLPVGGLAHLFAVGWVLTQGAPPALGGWLVLDALGKLFLGFVAVLYALLSLYAVGYLALRPERANRVFVACMLIFPGTSSVVFMSHHLGLLWVALETTTLCSAGLLLFNRNARSLEAMWKYLLIGSVGIALALMGSLFLAYSELHANLEASLLIETLARTAPLLSKPWLHAAFVVATIGYGTKMGLAPMHTWKPDAYGEAPGVVGALLAGGMTSCAFIAVLRFFHVCVMAGDAGFAKSMLVTLGVLSMAVAAVFMARQRDYKRLLAYSSVEHMGILVLGIGIGGNATFGSLLHLLNNGFTKGVLFLSAANIHRAYASKSVEQTTGALRLVPLSGTLFLLGFIAITGSPPFGPFISEFTILDAALGQGRWVLVGLFLLCLFLIFTGMSSTVLSVVQGTPPPRLVVPIAPETFLTIAPTVVFLLLSLTLGLYLPAPLEALVREAARDGVAP